MPGHVAQPQWGVTHPVPPASNTQAPPQTAQPSLIEQPDPPTARTRALHASMRDHESTARGSRKALVVMIGATVVCALGFVLLLLLRGG